MQCGVEVPCSSFSFSSSSPKGHWLASLLISMIVTLHLPTAVHPLPLSTCSPHLFSTSTDQRTRHEHIQPCPVSPPCQCLCEQESKRLWIDCFHRQLTSFPLFQTIASNRTRLEWNVDLAFNLFDKATHLQQTTWLPENMHIHHMVLSGSLAYDLILQLNLTHRRLIDQWPSQTHLSIVDDDEANEEVKTRHWRTLILSPFN